MQSVSVAGAETHKAAHETPTNGEHLADTYIRHLPVYIAQLRRRTAYAIRPCSREVGKNGVAYVLLMYASLIIREDEFLVPTDRCHHHF